MRKILSGAYKVKEHYTSNPVNGIPCVLNVAQLTLGTAGTRKPPWVLRSYTNKGGNAPQNRGAVLF